MANSILVNVLDSLEAMDAAMTVKGETIARAPLPRIGQLHIFAQGTCFDTVLDQYSSQVQAEQRSYYVPVQPLEGKAQTYHYNGMASQISWVQSTACMLLCEHPDREKPASGTEVPLNVSL